MPAYDEAPRSAAPRRAPRPCANGAKGLDAPERRISAPLVALFAAAALSGCAVIGVVGTAVETTGDVVGTGVDVILAPVDAVVGDDEDDDEDE
ncbi:MAG: hypothetical protein AAGM38_12325 [Pseudomonadota bacterium]